MKILQKVTKNWFFLWNYFCRRKELFEGGFFGGIFKFLANEITSNVREMVGALNRVLAFSKIKTINPEQIIILYNPTKVKIVFSPGFLIHRRKSSVSRFSYVGGAAEQQFTLGFCWNGVANHGFFVKLCIYIRSMKT